jgi:hypothetical protein
MKQMNLEKLAKVELLPEDPTGKLNQNLKNLIRKNQFKLLTGT